MIDHSRESLIERAARNLLKRATLAAKSPIEFFSLVVREETTQTRVECLPFQRLVYKFVQHFDRCVIRMPVGFSKTYTMAALSMWLLGNDCTTRGAIISASQSQAQKPLAMVRNYIEHNPELKLVFPKLRKSTRDGDPWTQNKITIERPPGIRDASLSAVGFQGKLPGARLNWILVDDILTEENAKTEEQRQSVLDWFNSTVLSRRDIRGTKIVVANSPWHPEDLTYRLEKAGWPTLTIDIDGNIRFSNTCATDMVDGAELPLEGEFDCDDIRPSHIEFPTDENGNPVYASNTRGKAYRLTAHDNPVYDPDQSSLPVAERNSFYDTFDVVPLWPERYGVAEIAKLKHEWRSAMHEYNRMYRCICRDDSSGKVKLAWIENCKAKARELDVFNYASTWDPSTQGATYTGVDLGVGKKRKNDRTSIFTFAVLPDGTRRILRIDSGRYDGAVIIDKISEHYEMFGSIIRVETNAAQDFLRQWAKEKNRNLPIRGAFTGKNKHDRAHGVESIFIEIENGNWLIPNDAQGGVTEETQRWIDSMLYYDQTKHTGDELMSSWLAREQARHSGAFNRKTAGSSKVPGIVSIRSR